MSRRPIRALAAALVVAVALVLSACASIPDAGPVRPGGTVAQVDDPLDLDFNPSKPEKGASPQRIVQGFIDAASSPKNNFQIAREYLTSAMAATWNPDESVTVDDGRNRTYDHDGDQWSVEVDPVASVDSVGTYHPATTKAPIGLRYELVKQDGEWRIAVAPNGVVIDDPTFRAVYTQQTLYFYSPDFGYLVPDARWFPARVATSATRVASAVLAGPAKWLAGAVSSAFPDGTQLAVPSVTTAGGVAQVDLSSEAGRADTVQLQRMQLQLEQSLGSLAQSVQLSIEGNVEQISPLSSGAAPQQDPPVDSHPIVYRGDTFGLLSGSSVASLSGLGDRVVALQPTAVALDAARDQAAVLSAGGAYLVRRSGDTVRVDARPGLIAPTIDNSGWVLSVPGDAPAAVQATGSNGEAHAVATDWPTAVGIQSIAVSRDGTRIVALLQTSTGYSLVASGIVRGSGGVPTSLTQPVELAVGSGTPLSVAWTSELSAVLLTSTNGDATSIVEQTIGGEQTVTTGPGGGRTIVGANGLARYLVLTSEGSLQAPTGTGWQAQADKVGAVAVQLGQP
ncbi:GerMN domain-containing protein [Leifsonia sp. 71-9]|uniref:GerMN domain-containing protein n=1 Tax=Leifsonia sp. 71-9 TaxID=1895934 RepID=UPI000B1C90EA|nr:GerMN domain-containing protein [Leifsonia sp. 71-9]